MGFLDSLRAQGKIPGQTDEVIKKKPVYNKKKKPKFVEKAMEEKTSVDLSEKLNNIELNEIKKNDDEESDDWDKASDISEEEERKRLEEEENERIRLEEERIRKIQEEEERKKLAKEKAKQKKKDRIALMKKEGTYKTK